ncbi:MAG: hypothetical protein H6509_08785 [Bryobacterales bacterium]|nr:hypothetical protein [Bryobacterales bacterium]
MARKQRTAAASKPNPQPAPPRGAGVAWGPLLAVASGVLPALLVLAHAPGLNGTPYWPWRYGDATLGPIVAVAGLAFALAWAAAERYRSSGRPGLPLALLAAVHVALILGFAALTDQGLAVVGERIRHPDITSYHTEAARIDDVSGWLDHYDERLPQMIGHTQTHPPGPILYYMLWNRWFGPEAGADAGGLFLALLSGLAIPLVYIAAKRATAEADSAFAAALAWTPLPAVILMLGAFDAVYPLFTLGLIALWTRAAWDGDLRAAAGFGALLALALSFTHSFLVLGAFFALAGLAPLVSGEDRQGKLRRLLTASAVGAGVCVTLFVGAWAIWGYDHLAALRVSMGIQEGLAKAWNRPWRLTVVWDVYDFFLASGWALAAVVTLFVVRWAKGGLEQAERLRWFALAALGTLAIVDVSGLLRAETARVWLFLQPLAVIVAGAELARWSPGWRAALIGVLFFALAAIRARIIFI